MRTKRRWGTRVLLAGLGVGLGGALHCQAPTSHVRVGGAEACFTCHRSDFERAAQPLHSGVLSEDCAGCHEKERWAPAAFDHAWPLTGAHATTICAGCHAGAPPVYAGTPTTCLACHEEDRSGVAQPSHAGFSDDCATCHGTASWDGASFEHTSSFPLLGAHQTTECMACHADTFAGTARDCVACHRADFDASPFPGHADFATTCQDCHTESGWVPASGGHPEDRFSITGKHDYACDDCHDRSLGPNGAGNADCVGCHEGEHSLGEMDRKHAEERDYPTEPDRAPSFCLDCHSDGK